jgi:hypothetical protein
LTDERDEFGISMIRTLTTTTSALVRAVKLGMIAIAALLVAGSIATSMARPAAKSFTPVVEGPDGAALNAVQPPAAEITVWQGARGEWSPSTTEGTPSDINGGVTPLLLRFDGVEAGKAYTLGIRYRTCGGTGAHFDALTAAPAAPAASMREFPGPGRNRPDSLMAVPTDHAVDVGSGASVALWGGTFTSAARGTIGSGACANDAIIELPVRAQADHLAVTVGGHMPAGSAGMSPTSTVSGFISPAP